MNIILVDDHQLFRTGLRLLISSEPDINVIEEMSNGIDTLIFIEQNSRTKIDIILLDIAMPEMDGITLAKNIGLKFPEIKIIALTMYGEEEYYHSMVKLGVKGFLLKNSNINEVIEALKIVNQGGTYFSRELLTSLIDNILKKDNSINYAKNIKLSEREIEIINLICQGLTTGEIATNLQISKRTVDKHRANILEKTETKNTANLVVYAIKHKLIQI